MRNHMTTNNFSPSTSQRWLEENIGKQTRHYGGTVGTNLRSESLGSRQAMIVPWYLLLNMKLTTLWRGTHHVITPGYPLLHVPPSNKVASSPRRGLVPTLKPQESLQDLLEGDPHSNPMKGHPMGTKVNPNEHQ